jgi:hypothetical protein
MAHEYQRLELHYDDLFQRAAWRWQRIGWAFWSLVMIAGAVGLLGSGPLNHSTGTAGDGHDGLSTA